MNAAPSPLADSAAASPPSGLNADPRKWSIDDVVRWAQERVGLDEEDAMRLKGQKIHGKSLFGMTEEKFQLCGIPGGPATKLMMAIEELKSEGMYIQLVRDIFNP